MNSLQSMAVGACIASLTIHSVAGACGFRAPRRVRPRTLAVSACFMLAGTANLLVLANKQPYPTLSIVAILLYAAFQGLFFAALRANRKRPLSVVFTADDPLHIVQSGPYRHIRHPFYAAYCGTWVAGAVGSASLLLAGVAAECFSCIGRPYDLRNVS